MTANELRELDRLASGYCDDGLSASELAELERAIVGCPVRRKRFLEMTALHGSLAWTEEAAAPSQPPPRHRRWVRFALFATALAAAVLIGVVIRPSSTSVGPDSTASFARITESEGTEVVGPDGRPGAASVGGIVGPGSSVRTAGDGGRAVLTYPNGTRLELAAASAVAVGTWTPTPEDGPEGQSVSLEYGVVQAAGANVGSMPLLLTTPHAVVRMLAATLICTASADATRVEVLGGRVDLVRRADGRSIELAAGGSAVATRDPIDPLVARRTDTRVMLPRFDVRVSGSAFALSPDGKRLATFVRDKITIWNGRTGTEEFTLPTFGRAVHATAFTPDSRTLFASRDNDTITSWDMDTRTVRSDDSTAPGPRVVGFSPDGRWRATGCSVSGSPAVVEVKDMTADVPSRTFKADDSGISFLAFAPNAKELAAATPNRGVVVWDMTKGTERASLKWDIRRRDRAEVVAYSSDGRWLAGGLTHRSAIRIWDAVTLAERVTLSGQGRVFRSIAFSPDSRLVAAGTLDGTLFIWNVETGEERLCERIDNRAVRFLTYTADGTTLIAATESGLVLHLAVNGK